MDTTSVFYQQYKAAEYYEASDEQIAVLKKAAETNTLEFSAVGELVEQALACIEDKGIAVIRQAPEELGENYLIPRYSIAVSAPGMTDAQADLLSNECIDQYSYYAEAALQMSPQATDARDARLVAELPTIIDCLAQNGVAATEDETPDEIRIKVRDLLVETNEAGAAVMCYDDFTPDQ
ncbi:hypothetical protein [Demequina sp.]|uniref:hypothetical protein n=1 Tax=Demequina sp. TaxID=2050685 RepID=UPI003D11101B